MNAGRSLTCADVRRRSLGVCVICAALLWAAPALSQLAMPDANQMTGVPLGAPELPNATVMVRVVRERMGNNVAGQVVTVTGGGVTRSATTDAQGRAQFDGFPAGTSVQAEANVGGEALKSQAFSVPAKGGVRVALVAGLAQAAAAEEAAANAAARMPARSGLVEFGGESRLILEFQDDTLQVFYLLDILNNARTPVDIGGPLLIDLPPGAAGASMLEGSSPQASVRGEKVTITGPFPPGKITAQIGFALPGTGASLSIRQKWPVAVPQIFVAVEKIGPMQMTSSQLTGIRETVSDGQAFIMGNGGRLNAGDTLAIDLSGLPSRSAAPRNAALAIAALILALGIWAAASPGAAVTSATTRLEAQRERMVAQLVAIERQRRRQPLAAQEEARRQRLVTDLERVLAELDHAPATGGEGAAA